MDDISLSNKKIVDSYIQKVNIFLDALNIPSLKHDQEISNASYEHSRYMMENDKKSNSPLNFRGVASIELINITPINNKKDLEEYIRESALELYKSYSSISNMDRIGVGIIYNQERHKLYMTVRLAKNISHEILNLNAA